MDISKVTDATRKEIRAATDAVTFDVTRYTILGATYGATIQVTHAVTFDATHDTTFDALKEALRHEKN